MEEIEKSVAIITESLTKLQNLVEPMHNQTHKQNRLETNISSLLSKLEQLLSALNDPTSLEAALSQLQFLAPFNIVVAVSAKARLALYAQNKLKLLLTDYDNYLKTIDPELKNLSNLFNESYKILSQCGHTVDPLPHVTNFVSTRSTLLITSLPQNTTFSVYATSFFKTLKTERDLVSKLFPKQVATQTFINTIIPIVDVWLEYCNTTITRCKAKFSVDGEVMDVDSFECIIEMVEILSTLSKEYEGLLAVFSTNLVLRDKRNRYKQYSIDIEKTRY